jgi:tetratricopeptide (TPR) repeat protein
VTVRSRLAALAPHLGLPPSTAIEEAVATVLDALRRGQPYHRWLLIFDNADQPEDLNDFIPREPGHVLITSRDSRWDTVAETLLVDVFDRSESVQFLSRRVSRAIADDDAGRLAAELGDLPLALEQAGALQAETGISVDEYLNALKAQTGRVLIQGKPPEYPTSMTAAWQLSAARLKEKMPEAESLLQCCAFFGPEPIPVDVFRGPIQSARPQLAEILNDIILRMRAIQMIVRFGLARLDPGTRTLQVHRLVQALLQEELPEEERGIIRHEVHQLLARNSPRDPDDESVWPRFEELVAHVRPSRLATCRNEEVRAFALKVARYLYRFGDRESCRTFVELFLEHWTEDSGPDDPDVLKAQRQLGNLLRDLGEYRAAYDIDSAALARARNVLGEHDEDTLLIMNSFGADLRARGEFAAAMQHDEDSLRRHEAIVGNSDRRSLILRPMNNLALDYGLVSQYEKARELQREVYRRRTEAGSGANAFAVLLAYCGLARLVRLCGDYREACYLGEDAFAFGSKELGAEHFWTLRTAIDLSIAQRRAGQHDEALAIAKDTFDRCSRLFGADNPDTLAAAMSLANIQRTSGEVDAAYELAEDTVKRYPKVYGEDHPYNHGCAGNLALLRRVRGDVTGAFELNVTCLERLDAKLGRDHHYSLTVATNMASDLAAMGDLTGARELEQQTLVRLRKLLGEAHPLTLGCAANLAADHKAVGADEEAEELAAATYQAYDSTLGPDHPDTQVAKRGRHLDFDFDPPPI